MKSNQPHFISQYGFTFVELIIVCTIISILAALALPAYQTYKGRAKASEAFSLSITAKNQIADFYRQTGGLPTDNTAAGLPAPEKITGTHVKSLQVKNGVVILTFKQSKRYPELSGKILSLHPRIVSDSPTTPISFQCGKSDKPLPEGIVVVGNNLTTLPKELMPASCN